MRLFIRVRVLPIETTEDIMYFDLLSLFSLYLDITSLPLIQTWMVQTNSNYISFENYVKSHVNELRQILIS